MSMKYNCSFNGTLASIISIKKVKLRQCKHATYIRLKSLDKLLFYVAYAKIQFRKQTLMLAHSENLIRVLSFFWQEYEIV